MHVSAPALQSTATFHQSLYDKINTRWHKPALQLFMLVVLAHWAEHIAQAWQIYVLGWPAHHAGGVLGLWYPWLVHSEVLHYSYALIMLIGIWVLRKGFTGTSRKWWTIALVIQFWHHFEHLLLIGQATFHHNLFGAPAPTSIVQLLIPRVELHLFYNTIVFIPMVAGMYYHMFPRRGEAHQAACACSWRRQELANAGSV
ncbi:MAG TPA: hypothetical protein VKY85_23430 [Candidatus Angelobacter sp.]|nr:hypothetical protein [Candidatus Angelobacter sp.]